MHKFTFATVAGHHIRIKFAIVMIILYSSFLSICFYLSVRLKGLGHISMFLLFSSFQHSLLRFPGKGSVALFVIGSQSGECQKQLDHLEAHMPKAELKVIAVGSGCSLEQYAGSLPDRLPRAIVVTRATTSSKVQMNLGYPNTSSSTSVT